VNFKNVSIRYSRRVDEARTIVFVSFHIMLDIVVVFLLVWENKVDKGNVVGYNLLDMSMDGLDHLFYNSDSWKDFFKFMVGLQLVTGLQIVNESGLFSFIMPYSLYIIRTFLYYIISLSHMYHLCCSVQS
jgi:hypothetical protein